MDTQNIKLEAAALEAAISASVITISHMGLLTHLTCVSYFYWGCSMGLL